MSLSDIISSSISKALFKAISWYVNRAVWVGYFIQTSNCCSSVSEEDSKTIAIYLFKKNALRLIDDIKYELEGLGYSEEIIAQYIESFVSIIKEKEPLVYLLYNIKNLSTVVSELKSNLDTIANSLQKSVIYDCLSIDDIDERLKRSSLQKNHNISLEFFDFNDPSITNNLNKLLDDKEKRNITVSGNYSEETYYALLLQLKKKYENEYLSRVVVVESVHVLNRINDEFPEDTIVVFNTCLLDEDVVRNKRYVNIHVVSKDEEHDLFFNNRLKNSTRVSLEKCGFNSDEINDLFVKCGNNYPLYKSHLFDVTSKYIVNILRNIPKKYVGCLLLVPKWSLSTTKDRELIETFTGAYFDDLLDEIMPKAIEDAPFVKKITGIHRIDSVRVIPYRDEDTFYQLKDCIKAPLLNKFFLLAKEVLEDIPSNYLDKNNIYSFSNEKCSEDIREGVLHTLIMLSVYCGSDVKARVEELIKELINTIRTKNSFEYYRYFSSILPKLVESSPKIVFETLKEDLDEKKGLYQLFIKDSGGTRLFWDVSEYQSILYALQLLLFVDEYKNDSMQLLFNLGLCELPNDKSKYIKEILTNSLLACIKMVPFSIDDKKRFLQWMFEKDHSLAYEICMSIQYERNQTVVHYHGPSYLHYEAFSNNYLYSEVVDLYTFYAQTAVKNAISPKELAELVEKNVLIHYGEPFLKESLDSIVKSINRFDNDIDHKEIVASAFRRLIYRNRHFANSDWALPEAIISLFEKSLEAICYMHQESKYVHLFTNAEVFEPHPIIYDSKKYDYHLEMENRSNYVRSCCDIFVNQSLDIKFLLNELNIVSKDKQTVPSEDFIYLYQRYYNQISEEELYYQLICDVFEESILIQRIGTIVSTKDVKMFFDIAMNLKNSKEFKRLNQFLLSYKIDYSDKDYVAFITKKLPKKQRDSYFKSIPEYIQFSNDLNTLGFILNGIKSAKYLKKETNKFVTFIYYYSLRMTNAGEMPFIFDVFSSVADELLAKTYSPRDAVELVKKFQSYYANTKDEEIIRKMIILEMKCGFCNEYQKPLFLLNHVAKNAEDYYWLIKPLYFRSKEEQQHKNIGNLFSLVNFTLLFCPGYVNGIFDEAVFDDWVVTFEKLALGDCATDSDKETFYHIIGKLFGCSTSDPIDQIKPPKKIRAYIEKVPSAFFKCLSSSYRASVSNAIGVRNIGDGSDLVKIAREYKRISLLLAKDGYIKTAEILAELSTSFEKDGMLERKEAED